MAVGTRTIKLGRFRALGLMTNLQETLGDLLETVGGGVVSGERRPRPFNLELPIRGDGTDGDYLAQRTSGERLRRQIRSLMDNQRVKLNGLYFHSLGDHELSAWLVVGGGTVEPVGQAASARAEWKLVLQDCFKVASSHTHMDALRIEMLNRGLITTPRDIRGQVYSTDFAGQGDLRMAFLGPGYRVATGMMGLLEVVAVATMEGSIGLVAGVEDGEVLMFEQREGLRHHSDVILHDRRGITTIATTLRTNLEGNPSFEDNTTGYATGGTNTLTRVYGPAWNARTGHWGLKATYSNNLQLVTRPRTFPSSGTYTWSVYVKIPREWDGGAISLDAVSYAGSSGETTVAANMSIRDTWQRLTLTITIAGGDLVGTLDILAASAPTVGRYILVDDVQVELAGSASAYFDGDSRFCRWTGTIHASTSESYGDPEDFGWEEIFGENWALYDHTDPPVMSNGRCRIRREPAVTSAVGFAVDTWVQSVGWTEIARFHMGASAFPFTEILASHVVEWSPERAVVAVHLNSATTMAATLYITLQRGWQGPRLELYGEGPDGILPGDLYLDYAPNDANHMAFITGELEATNPVAGVVTDEPGAAQGLVWNPVGTDEPWVMLCPVTGSGLAHVAHLTLANVNVYWTDDTFGYGSTRRGLSFVNESDIEPVTYIGVQFATGLRMPVLQAEDATNGSGSTDVADANGRGGNAVESSNTADPAGPSITFTPSQIFDDTTIGNLVAVWARVRVVTGGATGQVQMNYGADATNGPVSFTSTTFVWVRVDETARTSGQDLDLELWRSAGSGAVRIDSVIVVPLEQRAVGQAYSGVVDFSDRCMWDLRQTPDLVSR